MLREDDLGRFKDHFRAAAAGGQLPADPAVVLQTQKGLFPEEIWQLAQSLQIAAVLGDSDRREAVAADLIARQVRGIRCISFDQSVAWQQAIAWALTQSGVVDIDHATGSFTDRSEQVGQACRRLRSQRYQISVTAYGVLISDQSQRAIAERIDGLIAHLGGAEAAMQVCRIIEDSNLIYDGMWLLGDRIPSIWSTKRPAFPVGWLFSLSLRHIGQGGKASKPPAVWETIVRLATDFAAAMNCQRYSQFEDIDVYPGKSWRVLRDSLLWREIFVLPQVPRQVVASLRDAFGALITPEEEKLFDWRFEAAFDELDGLLSRSASERLTFHSRLEAAQNYPNLWRIGIGEVGQVNRSYTIPTAGGARNQSKFIFFVRDKDTVLTLPPPFLREAFCQAAFAQIWSKLQQSRASEIVGKTFERALERACQGKTARVHAGAEYTAGKTKFEIDVATRDNDRIVLFETKAKPLTAQARSGDMMAFYADYIDSYLAMVRQLVRHEDHLRKGLTPLTTAGEVCHDFRPLKVAVSPLSFGPVSDKMLASGLLRSFANVALHPVSSDAAHKTTVDRFNKAMRKIYDIVPKLAPKTKDGTINLFAYFIDVFWLDLGEVLYVLDRANTVVDAFTPLKVMTFTTRDFWTEVAFADAQGFTKIHWRPLPT
ncbi:MAG: hypothetical protein QOE55_2094 [Acidobacteriaceae bacterium]|nr:hypothetical protein [Acidobacteriaceae bacterium]